MVAVDPCARRHSWTDRHPWRRAHVLRKPRHTAPEAVARNTACRLVPILAYKQGRSTVRLGDAEMRNNVPSCSINHTAGSLHPDRRKTLPPDNTTSYTDDGGSGGQAPAAAAPRVVNNPRLPVAQLTRSPSLATGPRVPCGMRKPVHVKGKGKGDQRSRFPGACAGVSRRWYGLILIRAHMRYRFRPLALPGLPSLVGRSECPLSGAALSLIHI